MKKMKQGSDSKLKMAMIQERKKLGLLEDLKKSGGTFISAEQVNSFLALSTPDEKKKKQRLKQEAQYARVTSTLLLRVYPIF